MKSYRHSIRRPGLGKSDRSLGEKQHGFTLVELLVGLILTIFISAIAITYMVSSSQSFRVQTADSLSHENARFALELLSQNIRLGGYSEIEEARTFPLDGIYLGNNSGNTEDSNANGDNNACTADDLANTSDRLAVDYIANTNVTGCNGSIVNANNAAPQRMVNVFWTADLDGDGVRSLYCQTLNVTPGAAAVAPGAAQAIIDGVDALQVQYGVTFGDDSTNPAQTIQRYQSFDNLINSVTPDSDPRLTTRNVKAVRLALLVNSGLADDGDNQLERPEERTYQLLDASVTIPDDRILRQIYTTTIAIPNNF